MKLNVLSHPQSFPEENIVTQSRLPFTRLQEDFIRSVFRWVPPIALLLSTAHPANSTPPITNEFKQLYSSDAAAGDRVGPIADMDGDFSVLGAKDLDSFRGAAYLFGRDEGGTDNWGEVKKIVASDGAAGDGFGISVAIDSSTLVIGANGDDDDGSDSGSVYIYYRNEGGSNNWGQKTKIVSSDAAAGHGFGHRVAISGNLIAVSALRASTGGSVYIFSRNEGGSDNWGEVKKLTGSDTALGDDFGSAVDLSGDKLIVGAIFDDDSANDAGAAFIFEEDYGGTANWGQVVKLTDSGGGAGDQFGHDVAVLGGVAAVGGDLAASPGAVFVFHINQGGTNNWGQVAKVTASDGVNLDSLGDSVALHGNTLIASATADDSNKGSLYLFSRNHGGADNYGERAKFVISSAASGDSLGNGVALNSTHIVSGAPGRDTAGSDAGGGAIFEIPDFSCSDGTALPATTLSSGQSASEVYGGRFRTPQRIL